MRTRGPEQGCGPDCRFRRLYDGSQESLNDMAGKHAAALGRVAQLRAGVLASMKQAFPTQYGHAEQQLGHKLVDERQDSVLLAFLEAFLATTRLPAAVQAPAGLEELRAALAGVGVSVQGSDLRSWASSVSTATLPAHPAASAAAPAHVTPEVPVVAAVPTPTPSPQVHAPSADVPAWEEPDDIPWLDVSPDAGLLDDMPTESNSEPQSPQWDLAHLFDEQDSTPSSRPSVSGDDASDLLDSLWSTSPGTPEPEPPAPVPGPVLEPGTATPGVTPEPSAVTPARTAAAVLKPEMFPAATLPRAPKAAKRTPRTARVSRVSADAPGAVDAEAAAETSGVATERFGELLAMVSRPKPVFLSDMVAASGSPGLVSAWESHISDMGGAAPVRVITPRAHHRDRGALVVPHAQELRDELSAQEPGWWAQCLDDGPDRARLRGARLYETAVVLHRFAEEIVSFKLGQHVLSLRLNTPSGMTGAVLWVGSDSPSGEGRDALTTSVAELVSDRLVLLAVLTPESGARAVDRIAGLVAESAAEQGWSPTMPLVASHSWEFASSGGSSALAIL